MDIKSVSGAVQVGVEQDSPVGAPAQPSEQVGGTVDRSGGGAQLVAAGAVAAHAAERATLVDAMHTAPADELAAKLASAKDSNPSMYREALREVLAPALEDYDRLGRHLKMLDTNNDNEVRFGENYNSMRALDLNPAAALFISGASQFVLALQTNKGRSTAIDVNKALDTQHPQVHTGGFDEDLELAAKLDEMMAEDLDGNGTITFDDMSRLIDKRAEASDANVLVRKLVGAVNRGEFNLLFEKAGGEMSRSDLRDFYTGSFFYSLLAPEALAEKLVALREPNAD